jgi:hypothetical protein
MLGRTFITLGHMKIFCKCLDCQNHCGFYQLLIHNKKPMGFHGLKINEKTEFHKSNFFKVIFTHFYLRIKFMKQDKDEIYIISNDK